MFETDEIVPWLSFMLLVIIQTGAFGVLLGRLFQGQTNLAKDVNGLGHKVAHIEAKLQEDVVTKEDCENRQQYTLKEQNIYNTQNIKDHENIMAEMKEIQASLLDIHECLHKIQNNKEC